PVQEAAALEVLADGPGDVVDVLPREPAELAGEDAELIDRRQDRKGVHLAEGEVLRPAPGGDVHEPGALRRADVGPRDHAVLHPLLGGEVVVWTGVDPSA